MFKRSLILISTIAIATSLTACTGAGNNAPTRMINQVTEGVEVKLSDGDNLIYVRNLLVVAEANGDATLIGTIVNQNPTEDALVAVGINGAPMTLGAKNYPVLQNKPIIFGGESSNASAVLKGANLIAGHRVDVKLFLGLAGSATANALVVGPDSPYAK